jgi:hypothetical protein
MLYYELVDVVERRLGVSIDVCDDAAKYLRFIAGLGAEFCIEVLKLDLLAAKVVCKASKVGAFIFLSVFVFERVWRTVMSDLRESDRFGSRFSMRLLTALEVLSSREPIMSTGALHLPMV